MRRTNVFTLKCCIACFHFWFNSSTKALCGSLSDINIRVQEGHTTENTAQLCTTLFTRTDEASPDCLLRAPASGRPPAYSGVHGRYVQEKGRFVPLSNQITEAFLPQILVKTMAQLPLKSESSYH